MQHEVQCHTCTKVACFAWIFRHRSTRCTFSRSSSLSLLENANEFAPQPLAQRNDVTTHSITVVTSQVLYCFSQDRDLELWWAVHGNDIATVQRLLAAGADPNSTIGPVGWRFYIHSLAVKTHVAQQFLSLAFRVWRDRSKKKKKNYIKSSPLAPTPRAACVIIRKRLGFLMKTWHYNIIKESKHLRHANVDWCAGFASATPFCCVFS